MMTPSAVASFTDAWIETFLGRCSGLYVKSHLLQMRGLKQDGVTALVGLNKSRIFYRCVD